jgi:ABC-type branched-subunit amino acid transport system substrate-binding protein
MRIKRTTAGALLGIMLLLALVFIPGDSAAQTQKQQPIVFALIDPLSGPFKDVGTEFAFYAEYTIEQINARGGLLGRPIKLMQYDNQMKPDIAMRMARKAVMEDGAKVLMSHASSAVGLALEKIAKELNVIHLIIHAEADEMTGSEFQPNSFRVCLSTSMHSRILANYYAQTPYKRFYLINQDYSFGHAVGESFKKEFQRVKRADQEIVGEDYHPLATKDFGPYVTKALAAKPDVVITGNFGPDLPGLMRQARDLGLKAEFGTFFLDNTTYTSQVRDAGPGSVTAELYLSTITTKKNQEFVKSWQAWFRKHYPDRPAFYLVPSSMSLTVDGMNFLGEAIKKARSVDADKIIPAWEGMSFEGLTGRLFMRACDHQIQTPGFVATVQANHAFKNVIDFPYLGDPITIPAEKVAIPPAETGNPRCK